MDDPLLVRGFQRVTDLSGDAQRLLQRNRPSGYAFRERGPLHQFHHQVVRSDVVKMADVGMIQRRDSMNLALEPIAEPLRGDLDGNLAPHARIAGAVHLSHAAHADHGDDLVGAESCADGERHSYLPCAATRRRTSSKKFTTSVT